MAKRTIVVGDIHGCYDELQDLLLKCKYDPSSDRLISVGDLINKGPKSVEVLEFFDDNKLETILGNHEAGFLRALESGTSKLKWTLLREKMGDRLEYWKQWIEALPLFIEEDEFIVVHAGLRPDLPPEKTSPQILYRIRTWDGIGKDLDNPKDPSWHDLYHGKKLVIYGHWAVQGLCETINTIGLDTGCVYGGELSAVILPERRIISVKARNTYQNY